MIDRYIQPLTRGPIDSIASTLRSSNIGAPHVTLFTLLSGLIGMITVALGAYSAGLAFILLSRLLHYTGRHMAVQSGETAFGTYFARAVDVFTLSGFVFFFAMSVPGQGLGAAFLLFAYIALQVSKLPATADAATPKPIYHFGSLVGESETVIFMILACFYPVAFAAIATLFGTLCFVTVLGRLWDAAKTLR